MNIGVNKGSKIRTLLRIATSVNNAVCVTMSAVQMINNERLLFAWIAATIITDGVISYITTYYNNDYSEVSSNKTAEMRLEKAMLKLPQNKYAWAQDGGVDYTNITESEAIEDNGITIED